MTPPLVCDECGADAIHKANYYAACNGYLVCAYCPNCKSERNISSTVFPSASMAEASLKGVRFQ